MTPGNPIVPWTCHACGILFAETRGGVCAACERVTCLACLTNLRDVSYVLDPEGWEDSDFSATGLHSHGSGGIPDDLPAWIRWVSWVIERQSRW